MTQEPKIQLLDIVISLAESVDLISSAVHNHHKQVAYISASIASEVGIPKENINNIILAGALHDIGALSSKERLNALQFEIDRPFEHAETGYRLLYKFPPFTKTAEYIRYHHVPWENGKGLVFRSNEVPIESHILHLADRISVLIDERCSIINQVPGIVDAINLNSGQKFVPKLVNAFNNISQKESFWLDILSERLDHILMNMISPANLPNLNTENLADLANIFSRIVDFRSPFTASHSNGVASNATLLAEVMHFSKFDTKMMTIAGYLHDLGKLVVPPELLDKPGKLTSQEFNVIKTHTYHTFRILDRIDGLETINKWASFHHEKLNGRGYPFKLGADEIPLGSRIMAAADIFTALTEDRPYRKGMHLNKALQILEEQAENGALDKNVVSRLADNLDKFADIRETCLRKSSQEYKEVEQYRKAIQDDFQQNS